MNGPKCVFMHSFLATMGTHVCHVRILTGGWTLYGSAIFTRSTGFRPPAGAATPFGSGKVCAEGMAALVLGGGRKPGLGAPMVG